MERDAVDEASAVRGVAANTLVASFTAHLASHMGRVNASGRVTLVLPVSDRTAGDCRGNALRSISLNIDPCTELCELRELQVAIRSALALLLRHGEDLSLMFPLERFTQAELDHLQGQLFLIGYMTKRHYMVTVAGYAPGRITTTTQLRPLVRDALTKVGLRGEVT